MPRGTIGDRWAKQDTGKWNIEMKDGVDDEKLYSPAWQEKYTGIDRETVVKFAREFAGTAENTGGKCTVIIGAGINH